MIARVTKALNEKDKGFTLIELLVVIIIIGILAAIAIPVFLNQRAKGWDAAVQSDLKNLATTQETFLTENTAYATAVSQLEAPGFDFKYSSGQNYAGGTAAITINATGAQSYILTADSASGKRWVYNSALGGLQAPTATPAGP
jgi:type IV pilus assembly protein PilA